MFSHDRKRIRYDTVPLLRVYALSTMRKMLWWNSKAAHKFFIDVRLGPSCSFSACSYFGKFTSPRVTHQHSWSFAITVVINFTLLSNHGSFLWSTRWVDCIYFSTVRSTSDCKVPAGKHLLLRRRLLLKYDSYRFAKDSTPWSRPHYPWSISFPLTRWGILCRSYPDPISL